MNLHGIVAGVVGAVNPLQLVGIQISIGNTENADGSLVPAYATPGSITASIGGTLTASIPDPNNPTTLSVAAVLSGSLQVGDAVSGSDGVNALPQGCTILQQLSGTIGGVGTYELSAGTISGVLEPCAVTSASTVLAVSAIAAGMLEPGQTLAGSGALESGTLITGQLSGTIGGTGLYSISQQQTVAGETMTTSMSLLAQVQPLSASDLRHMDAINLQGSHKAVYISAPVRGIVRPALKGGDLLILPDGSVWLVTQPLESFYPTAGWNKFVITLQDGS